MKAKYDGLFCLNNNFPGDGFKISIYDMQKYIK